MNAVNLIAIVREKPEVRKLYGMDIVYMKVSVARLSGVEDLIDVCYRTDVYDMNIGEGDLLHITGSFASYNTQCSDNTKRVLLYVFATKIEKTNQDYMNTVELSGYICKKLYYKETLRGRRIAGIILAVMRENGKSSDYIPCIFWGTAADAVNDLDLRTQLSITGRIQSRQYLHKSGVMRIAHEISASNYQEVVDEYEKQ